MISFRMFGCRLRMRSARSLSMTFSANTCRDTLCTARRTLEKFPLPTPVADTAKSSYAGRDSAWHHRKLHVGRPESREGAAISAPLQVISTAVGLAAADGRSRVVRKPFFIASFTPWSLVSSLDQPSKPTGREEANWRSGSGTWLLLPPRVKASKGWHWACEASKLGALISFRFGGNDDCCQWASIGQKLTYEVSHSTQVCAAFLEAQPRSFPAILTAS